MESLLAVQDTQDPQKRSLLATYTYQSVEEQLFPLTILLQGGKGEEEAEVNMQLSNLQRNVSVKFPYTVPAGYQPLTLRP